jgi:hypothetical protein
VVFIGRDRWDLEKVLDSWCLVVKLSRPVARCWFGVTRGGSGRRTRTQPVAVLVLLLESGSRLTRGGVTKRQRSFFLDMGGRAVAGQSCLHRDEPGWWAGMSTSAPLLVGGEIWTEEWG